MKRRFHAGEWALLLIPCLLLVGVAAWKTHTNSQYLASDDPASPTILSAKIEPTTPLDVYNGWDTRFVLVAQVPLHLRQKPGDHSTFAQADFINGTLIFQRGNQKIVVPTSNRKMFQQIINNGESTTTTLLMRLRDVPATSSGVMLQGDVITKYFRTVFVGGASRHIRNQSKPIAIKLRVCNANERVVLPVVSRCRPLALDNVSVKHQKHFLGTTIQSDTTVKMIFSGTDASNLRSTPLFHNTRLVDQSGRAYHSFFSPNTKRPVNPSWGMEDAIDSPDGKYHQWISFPVGFLPKSAGRIKFKTEVSVDNCWPIEVSVVVRDK